MQIAYCTNVVAGSSLAEMRSQVERVFTGVRKLLASPAPLPLGLWLSATAAQQVLEDPDGARRLRDWLGERGLSVVTFNGFPYHQFHGPVVKHRVYEPHWADARRLLYTTQLVDLLVQLLPPDVKEASVSTLPIGWRGSFHASGSGANTGVASANLQQLARHCARVEDRTGVRVHVDLEPEPGCALDRASDAVSFFEHVLPARRGESEMRRHLGICHDVCHAAVMFESQEDVLGAYRRAGIHVGKVQLSSAPACHGASDELAVLASFVEPRYLHQTCVRSGTDVQFYEDLPLALAAAPQGEWRTHFHVPIFAERLGALRTTQEQLGECLRAIARWPQEEWPQLEVETYAWDVLPTEAGGPSADDATHITQGIAAELRWAARQWDDARAVAHGARA